MNEEAESKADILAEVCSRLALDEKVDAASILRDRYPFKPFRNAGRTCSPSQALLIFQRDGFIDRYAGLPLVFPGTLRILSLDLPVEFPYHPHGKTDLCHFAFWELFPTIDHEIPVSRGGPDLPCNWVTTSMAKNAAKANFLLSEIGWQLLPEGCREDWNGLTSWFSEEVKRRPALKQDPYVKKWDDALRKCAATT